MHLSWFFGFILFDYHYVTFFIHVIEEYILKKNIQNLFEYSYSFLFNFYLSAKKYLIIYNLIFKITVFKKMIITLT